jgi:hypothetical protein
MHNEPGQERRLPRGFSDPPSQGFLRRLQGAEDEPVDRSNPAGCASR